MADHSLETVTGSFNIIQSWGVASARHTSGTVVHHQGNSQHSVDGGTNNTEYFLDVPLGPSIIRWDVRSKVRHLQFQAHLDLVTCMRQAPNRQLIATSCYSGEVKLWDILWNCLDRVNAPMASQQHLAWSHDSKRFLIIGNGRNSSVVMYNVVSQDERGLSTLKIKQAWQVEAGNLKIDKHPKDYSPPKDNHQAPPSSTGTESAVEYHYGDAFYMGEITTSGNVFAIEERPGRATLMELYSPDGQLIKTVKLELKDDKSAKGSCGKKGTTLKTLFMSSYKNGCYAIGTNGGTVFFVKENLEILSVITVGFTSRTCEWDGDNIVLPTDSGKLMWWKRNGEKVREIKAGPPDYVVRLAWSVSGDSLWICGFSTLCLLPVKTGGKVPASETSPSHVIHSHGISCCGVGFSPSGRSIGSGDLAGNIWVTEHTTVTPTFTYNVSGSIRCLVWMYESVMLVGCLDGQLYEYVLGESAKVLFILDGDVIHMKFNHGHQLLAIGTSKGVLEVFRVTEGDGRLKSMTKFLAHPPKQGPQDLKFGQLGKQAEIWSLCWSPDDTKVATCSEDQTTRVWDTSSWKCLTILTGHKLAVTSVDWKGIGDQTLIASCADDRTIRLTDGESFKLLRILDTKDIYGWHTLTYLSFHPAKDSSILLCTTQNGHVVIWNSITGERVSKGKMHLGSIEGLVWKEESNSYEVSESWIATVGADCVVNVFTIAQY